jgi:transposase
VASLIAAGSDGRRGTVVPGAEAIHPIKLNGVDPQRYFTDLLTRLVNGWPNSRIDDLMPWCWAKSGNA